MDSCVCDSTGSVQILDPFDPTHLRLSSDFAANLGVKKVLTTVPVRKPAREWWVQVCPNEAYRVQTCMVDLKEDQEMYLVKQSLWPELAGEVTFGPKAIFTAVNRQGVFFLWPARLPGADGKTDNWSVSALEAIGRATGNWIRVVSNMSLGAYEVYETEAQWPAPQWPSESFSDLLRIAFKSKFIDSVDHPVVKHLRGRV